MIPVLHLQFCFLLLVMVIQGRGSLQHSLISYMQLQLKSKNSNGTAASVAHVVSHHRCITNAAGMGHHLVVDSLEETVFPIRGALDESTSLLFVDMFTLIPSSERLVRSIDHLIRTDMDLAVAWETSSSKTPIVFIKNSQGGQSFVNLWELWYNECSSRLNRNPLRLSLILSIVQAARHLLDFSIKIDETLIKGSDSLKSTYFSYVHGLLGETLRTVDISQRKGLKMGILGSSLAFSMSVISSTPKVFSCDNYTENVLINIAPYRKRGSVARATKASRFIIETCSKGSLFGGSQCHMLRDDEVSIIEGSYSDPNHPSCIRKIVSEGSHLYVYGSDNINGSNSWRLPARLDDSLTMIVDFSSKKGPHSLKGIFNMSLLAVQWSDGNMWTKLRAEDIVKPFRSGIDSDIRIDFGDSIDTVPADVYHSDDDYTIDNNYKIDDTINSGKHILKYSLVEEVLFGYFEVIQFTLYSIIIMLLFSIIVTWLRVPKMRLERYVVS
jgi:hypothetical protein